MVWFDFDCYMLMARHWNVHLKQPQSQVYYDPSLEENWPFFQRVKNSMCKL